MRAKVKILLSSLRETGNLVSLSFLIFVLVFLLSFAIQGSLFGGSIDSARYVLSALAQTQGAIIAIAISLTIVAVQVSSQAYSLRITDLLLKHPFFWFILFLYGISIVYDVTLLNRINDSNIQSLGPEVNISIFMAAIALWALFPYSKKTLERLRPQTIIGVMCKHILSENVGTFNENRKEGISPLFDAIKKAIRTDDITTARDGIKEIERVCCGIVGETLDEKDERAVIEHFCEQYQRSARIAFTQNDIDSVIEICRSLEQIAYCITNKELSIGRSDGVIAVADKLGDIGRLAIERKWEDTLRLIAGSLSDLSVKCVGWKTPGTYISDKNLGGVKRLSSEVIRDTSNTVLWVLSMLNLESMRVDVLLAARTTKRPLIYTCNRLIEEKLTTSFYEKVCVESILPLVRAIEDPLGLHFDWLPHVADILTALGTTSAETLGKGHPEDFLQDQLVVVAATRISEKGNVPEHFMPNGQGRIGDVILQTMSVIFNYINNVKTDAGAIWLIDAFERIGNEYNRKVPGFPTQTVLTHLGYIGSSLGFADKKFTVMVPRQALYSIETVLGYQLDSVVVENGLKAVLRIVIETDDTIVKERASSIFRESANRIEQSQHQKMVNKCVEKFRAENSFDLAVSAERRRRLEQFINDLSSHP
jgi:hypothetical protein